MMLRAIALGLVILITLPLAGCWSRIEVNDLAFVSMMAVDKTEKGRLKIWLQIVLPSHSGGAMGPTGGGGGRGAPFVTYSAESKTVLDASEKIQRQVPRRLFWAHMRVILIGEHLARDGVRQAIDFMTRQSQMRLTNYLLLVRGDPTKIMGTEVDLEKLPAEYLREILRTRIGTLVNLRDFADALATQGKDPILGVAEVVPPAPGAVAAQKSSLRLTGTALFRGDKLVGFIDEQTTNGLLWLRGEAYHGVIDLEIPGLRGNIAVEWGNSTVKRWVATEKGHPVIHVHARAEGDINEESASLDLSDSKVLKKIDSQMSREIRTRMVNALERMRELGTDSAGLGELVHQEAPGVWKREEKEWGRLGLRRAEVVLKVDAHTRRTGLSSKPRGVREEDLVK